MRDETISGNEFRTEVEAAADILRLRGFKRANQFEYETPTTVSVVYIGMNIAFTFSLDIRDQAIDLSVTQYRDGKLVPNQDGGYSSNLFEHLVNRCSFRGRSVTAEHPSSAESKAKRTISALVNLLTQPCAESLLADRFDALPQ